MQILRRVLSPTDTAYDSARLGGSLAVDYLLGLTAASLFLGVTDQAADSAKLGGTGAASYALLADIPSLAGYETSSHASSTYQTLAGMSGYQAALVSGTNIKTINSGSLLGSGDVTLATLGANTFTALQTVSLTNATDKLALQGAIYDVRVYGAKCDGTTDDSTAVQAAITAACNAAGGVIYFPAMTRVDSQLVIPNDAASPAPHQVPLLFKGSGSHWKGIASPIKGGGGLDLRYAGTVGKIVSYGLGLLAFEDMTFTNGGADSLPFVYVTNTTVLASRNGFIGASAASPLQDAFVLGGQGASVTGDSTGYFQGYGTVIERNYFDYINRGVLLQKNCNAVVIRENAWWTNCAGTAAIEDWNNSGNGIQGVMTSGNLIEMNGYTYGIAWHYAGKSVMVGDTFYDGGSFTSYYYFGNSQALPAYVCPGFYATAAKLASGSYYSAFPRTDAAGSLSLLDSTGGYTNSILKAGRIELVGNRMVFRAANNDEVFHAYTSTHNFYWTPQQADATLRFRDNSSNDVLTYTMPNGTFTFKNTKASTGYTYWETQAGAGQSTIPMGRWKDSSGNTNTTVAADGTFKFTGTTTLNWLANGQSCNFKSLTELTTIAAAATTSTAIQLPANALIVSVSVRVTTAVTCTSTFTVGDGGSAARYSTAAVSKAAGSTDPGTKAGIYYNATATAVVITPDTTPSDNTGRVRVTINYIDCTPPTS